MSFNPMAEKLKKLRQSKDVSISSFSINSNPFSKPNKNQDCMILTRKKNNSPDRIESLSKELKMKDL